MKVKIFQVWGVLFLFSSLLFADDLQIYASAICPGKYQHRRGSVRHIDGGGIGYDQGYTTIDGFFASEPNEKDFMPFLDFRGHIFNDGKIATNVGGGFRKIARNRIYGGNIYYDYRRLHTLDINQIGLGFETLGTRWDLRLNGYIPVGEKMDTPYSSEFSQFCGNNMLLLEKYRLVMTGANAEVGVHFGKSKMFDFYAAAGPYYFHEKIDCKPNLYGGKARLSAKFKQYWILEISDSYDRIFKNRFQAQLTLSIPFGAGGKDSSYASENICDALFSRMVQPVDRQEIIVIDKKEQCCVAIDPVTDEPYNFVFVDNESHSEGTYESPYPTLALAQQNSEVGDIIYVFPGDGTTRGMNSGITLKNKQKFWGSGVDHTLTTTRGVIAIPEQSSTSPQITSTAGNGITLAAINEVRGINITDTFDYGIFGADAENINISRCVVNNSALGQISLAYDNSYAVALFDEVTITNGQANGITIDSDATFTSCSISNSIFENNAVYTISTSFDNPVVLGIVNNTFTRNVNGTNLTFNDSGTLILNGNRCSGTTSPSSAPFAVASFANPLTATISGNTISNNICGALRLVSNNTNGLQYNIGGNTISNNTSGSQASLGSAIWLTPNSTTTGNCTLNLINNSITGSQASCLYCSEGSYNNFTVNATGNTITGNGGGGLAFDNPCTTFTLTAQNNTISDNNDNGIATLGNRIMTTSNITVSDNTITGNTGQANALAVAHTGTTFNWTVLRNNLSSNEGSGILRYSAVGVTNLTVDIENNTVNSNQNLGSNATGGIDIEQFTNLLATIKNNTMQDNTGAGLYINSAGATPTACITLTGNNSNTNYTIDAGTGSFNLGPCNASSLNVGTINTAGTVVEVQSCPGGAPCV